MAKSNRFTKLPCDLKIRLSEASGGLGRLEFRGDYGAEDSVEGRMKIFQARSGCLAIIPTARNLRAIAAFFTKEAKLAEEQS